MILQLTHPDGKKVVVHMRHVVFIREPEQRSILQYVSIGIVGGNELYVTETLNDILKQIPAGWGY